MGKCNSSTHFGLWLSDAMRSMLFRPCSSRGTPQPVMCGALVYSGLKYGVWDASYLKTKPTFRWRKIVDIVCCLVNIILLSKFIQAFLMIESGYRLPPPPGCTRVLYKINYDSVPVRLVCNEYLACIQCMLVWMLINYYYLYFLIKKQHVAPCIAHTNLIMIIITRNKNKPV